MDTPPDPFRTLGLAYDAGPDDVRRAFRRLARTTHPDRGGSTDAFHGVRAAYDALAADLDGARRRWQPPPPLRAAYAGGLDPRLYPTCPVRVRRGPNGTPRVEYVLDARPAGWAPGAYAPPGGTCRAAVAATDASPAFGVWTVPLDAHRYRCVFGPPPAGER